MTKAGVSPPRLGEIMKIIELKDLKLHDIVLVPSEQPEDQEIEVLEIRTDKNMLGDGSAKNYSGTPNSTFPYQWAGLRTAGQGYADTLIRVKD